jgi:hypothetical protein
VSWEAYELFRVGEQGKLPQRLEFEFLVTDMSSRLQYGKRFVYNFHSSQCRL